MLTDLDIKNLTEFQKEIFATKEDLASLEAKLGTKIDRLTNSVDAYAKQANTYYQEMLILSRRIERMEIWIKKVSDKVGIPFEF